jgi:sugar lactone lactonase YvrE
MLHRPLFQTILRAGALLCPAFLMPLAVRSQTPNLAKESAKPVISLEPRDSPFIANEATAVRGEATFANAPANFHAFASSQVGETTTAERLTLRFSAPTQITEIKASKDFQIEQGSNCAAGWHYSAGETCNLFVRFTPQNPGTRVGNLTVVHSSSPQPFNIGLGGTGYAPVVSFSPAVISTVAGTYPSNAGLLNGAQNLAVDGNDTLYLADTGNGLVRFIDSSGAIKTLASGYTGLTGIAVDNFGEVYFDTPSANKMNEIYDYGPVVQVSGTGTASCPAATPCNLSTEALGAPGAMSIDAYNHLFFVDSHQGAAMATVQPLPAKLIFLYDPFPYQTNPSSTMVADASDNLYSFWSNGGECEIVRSTLYDAENSNVIFTKIAGGHTCGFSGDGGEAGNAEIGATMGQMAFDLAGDLYFTDTANQRVRRIDYTTGIIHTIAGTGTAGYNGDAGPSVSAALSSPTGVGVDSQGQVYIISGAAATGTAQVVRKLGTAGILTYASVLKGASSSSHIAVVANTGNSALVLTNVVITGTNAADFLIDKNSTSCNLSPGATLNVGTSCKVGVIFKPTGGGTRTASLLFFDNTVTNTNTIQLSGLGTLPTPTFTITSPAASTSVASGTAVNFAVSVTSATSPVPTGTITFKVDATALGSVALSSTGTASVSVSQTTTGTHTLSASYSGDTNYAAAGPITRTYTVTAAPALVRLTSSANPAPSCAPTAFVVTVTGAGEATPTGNVTLKKGATVLGAAALNEGRAMIAAYGLTVGNNLISATYEGDAAHGSVISDAVNQVVSSSGCATRTNSHIRVIPPGANVHLNK